MLIYSNRSMSTGGGIGCLVFGILGMIAAFFILKGLFTLLMWAAPVLFVLALVVNWKAVADTGKSFLSLLQRNPLGGLLLGALGVVGFPVLALYLFLKALGYNKLEAMKQQFGGQSNSSQQPAEEEFIEFEELESRPKNAPKPPEPLEAPKDAPKQENPYDGMF